MEKQVYDPLEVAKVMEERGVTETKAKDYIYHKNYYNTWIQDHAEEKKEYRKNYYKENKK